MGRIDEALRRAASGEEQIDTVVTGPPESADAFVSPWTFAGETDEAIGGQQPPAGARALEAPADNAMLSPGNRLAVFRGFAPEVLERLVVGPKAPPLLTEQFRRLAAGLHHAQLVQGTKVIMVTSALAGDGKTFTAANLALTLSESYRRDVLLVDADLRRPSLHELFRVPNVAGLNEGLKADNDGQLSALKITETLTLLPAGRPEPDPMGGLSSTRMQRILEEASARFSWVIIDTAPIGLLADANLLGAMVDGAILVVRADRTPFAAVSTALEALGRDRVFGVVLNGVEGQAVPEYARYHEPTPDAPAQGGPLVPKA